MRTHDRGNSLHGGPEGFDVRLWDVVSHSDDAVSLTLISPDGDQGFPGTVTAHVRYAVSGDTVTVEMSATTDATTVVGMTNHAYWNLDGEGAGTIDDHVLVVDADEYTPVDDTGDPVGRARAGGRYAVRPPLAGSRSARPSTTTTSCAAPVCVAMPRSRPGRTTLEVWSDQPGLQVYTGDMLDGSPLRRPRGRRPRAAGLPRLAEPPGVALARAGAGGDLPLDDRVALQLLIMKISGLGSGSKPTRA